MNEEPHLLPGAQRTGRMPVRAHDGADEAPLRAELFNAAQMAVHGRQLAARHTLSQEDMPDRLLVRLAANAAAIAQACAALTRAAKSGRKLGAAAEALLDHYHLVDEQVRSARHQLPPHASRALPRLAGGTPRVYQLALEVVAHGDARLDQESLARFVAAYQEGAPLSLAELRAIPVMLRLALIDNLRRIAARVDRQRVQHELADGWAERMIGTADSRPGDLILLVADMARAVQPLGAAFVAALAQRLGGQGAALAQVLEWIGARLADEGLDIAALAAADRDSQAADAASMAHSIASLDLLAGIDWREFAETMSAVEATLRLDPCGTYGRMDGATRGHYRLAVERLALQSGQGEAEVAAEALALAVGADIDTDPRTRHVGYYLVDAGLPALRARLRVQAGPLATLRRAVRRRPLRSWLGAVGGFTLLFTAALLVHAYLDGAGMPLLLALGVLAAFGASQLALSLVNMMTARLLRPQPLPRLDFGAGIPTDARTLVAVCALLEGAEQVGALCAGLEVRYLANRDTNLRFCLLSDFPDAPQESMIEDGALLAAARGAIAELNARYGQAAGHGSDPFLLLHRARSWSESEGAWIGRGRKRGRLADLHAVLRGGAQERFAVAEGGLENLAAVRYVITLDAGTELPRDSARQLVATAAHPLNRPLLDGAGQRVVAGHAVLQPRIAAALPLDEASRYERLCGIEPGTTPGIYQDLFGQDAFGGKGIYEVDTVARVLGQHLPQDPVLAQAALTSELLDGCYLRAGLASDVELVEACPARYSDDIGRRHRRIRASWQLASWLRAQVPGPDGRRVPNPLPPLARWMLFDGLRRSLVAPTLVALLVLCWSLLPEPAFWSAAALAVFFLPSFIRMFVSLADKPHDMLWRQHQSNWWRGARAALGHAVMHTAFLPYETWYSLDAIARSVWRLLVTKRRLLEWKTPHLAHSSLDLETNWRNMWFAPALAVGTAVLLSFSHPFALFAAAPLLLLWFLSPILAWWLSLPLAGQAPQPQLQLELNDEQTLFLARLARRTWSFFETHAGPASNWLAPDQVQEAPLERPQAPAARTSPTSIGLGLLANLSAWDFGFIAVSELLARVRAGFDSMALLERYRGHFHSGYDTQTLAPMQPAYLSTTESGNLAGYLLTLATGLDALAEQPVAGVAPLSGARATLGVIEEFAAADAAAAAADPSTAPGFAAALARCRSACSEDSCRNTDTLPGLADCLQAASNAAAALLAALPAGAGPQLRAWCARLDSGCRAAHTDLLALTPWIRAVHEYVLDASLTRIPTLRELASVSAPAGDDDSARSLAALVEEGAAAARARLDEIAALARQARVFGAMDFGMLYRRERGLLAAGYHVQEERLDDASIGLLASEARLASFIGIAQDQLPQAHWIALRRQLGIVHGEQLLQSWSGAMSAYLQPLLLMPTWRGTLLDHTCRAAIRAQMAYARRHAVPWGISGAACHAVDADLRYQRRDFGVPGMGVRRGLGDDLVVAPYASMLALMLAPEAACANLKRLAQLGCLGEHGFYEALDYTGARLARGQQHAVVRAFTAAHQGMGLLALSHLLHGAPMPRRFGADPQCRAALRLLQERVPASGAFKAAGFEAEAQRAAPPRAPQALRSVTRPGAPQPEVQLLSNGRYHVMLTGDGGGYSAWGGLALTRWHADTAGGGDGLQCYLRDLDSGALWSGAWQPGLGEPEHYEVLFPEGCAELRRRDHGIELCTEIVVASDDDVELRRMRIKNTSGHARSIELTGYAEVALAPAALDSAHPAFSKLFVQTEILAGQNAILCTRRPREQDETSPWLLNGMAVHGASAATASFETSRAHFVGRGAGHGLPAALGSGGALGGHAGAVLDPAVAIRRVLTLAPGQQATVDLVLGAAASREVALQLLEKYGDKQQAGRVFELAWAHGQAALHALDASRAEAALYASLGASLLYPGRALRADPALIAGNARGGSHLSAYGLSGEHPIVLTQVRDAARLDLARQLLQAHAYWRGKGLMAELVIWIDDTDSQQGQHRLRNALTTLIAANMEADASGRGGGIVVCALSEIPDEDRLLMQATASVVLLNDGANLADVVGQLRRSTARAPLPPALHPDSALEPWATRKPMPESMPEPSHEHRSDARQLRFDNGIGGFSADGREYLVRTGPGQHTPAPWCNVLANPDFGSVVSESGQACTWSENAQAFRLTPWSNDPVRATSGEAFYVRDEQSGVFWSPTALPAPSHGGYLARHGFGYSVFEHTAHGIHSELTALVPLDAPLKYTVLKLRNVSSAPRRLSATGYVEWVLGDLRASSAMHVVTERDPASGALFARNAWNSDVAGRVAFFQVDGESAFTCDRSEFIGRGRSLAQPAALQRAGLAGTHGAALDPCAALQVVFELQPGEQKELVFLLGAGADRDQAGAVIARARGAQAAATELEKLREYWDETLGAVRIATPDPALDLLTNGWLLYQTLACRMWARGAFYQSGGAYGFRDQLQDAMALVHTRPQLLREHLLRCAARQFIEGDVQHWWQPSTGRGARSRCSDDYLWLPLAACRYIAASGDTAVLDEMLPYLEGRALEPGEESYVGQPAQAEQSGSLYEHCVRAIRHGLRFGAHGLPLIGSGDWNDSMDRVGAGGQGESVWLGFFMSDVLGRFADLAERRADYGFATTCRAAAQVLAVQLEEHAWDGAWYRRAFFDDGTPLGAARNDECRIDSIAQSWSVLSGAALPERAAAAMAAVDAQLVRREQKLVRLLDPPFDGGSLQPGSLRGYPAGVRENGGQYTHAAVWAAMAFARLGQGERAWELLDLLNPVRHALTPEDAARYALEPYVLAGDVHACAPHAGRGGWSWYTGSAGWMYRLIVESLLGLERCVGRQNERQGERKTERLVLAPQLPCGWPGFRMEYRYRSSVFEIEVRFAEAGALLVDGRAREGNTVDLVDDGQRHRVELLVPRRHGPALAAASESTQSRSIT